MDSIWTEGQKYIMSSQKNKTPHAYPVMASLSHPDVSFDTLYPVFLSTEFPPQK